MIQCLLQWPVNKNQGLKRQDSKQDEQLDGTQSLTSIIKAKEIRAQGKDVKDGKLGSSMKSDEKRHERRTIRSEDKDKSEAKVKGKKIEHLIRLFDSPTTS